MVFEGWGGLSQPHDLKKVQRFSGIQKQTPIFLVSAASSFVRLPTAKPLELYKNKCLNSASSKALCTLSQLFQDFQKHGCDTYDLAPFLSTRNPSKNSPKKTNIIKKHLKTSKSTKKPPTKIRCKQLPLKSSSLPMFRAVSNLSPVRTQSLIPASRMSWMVSGTPSFKDR